MNDGVFSPSSGGVFLVQCAACKCLAVHGANGRWKCLYNEAELPDDTEAILAVPIELILPFLPAMQRAQLCPVRLPGQR
jgi:hypothetical protein